MADKVEKTAPLSLSVEEEKMKKPARAARPLLPGVRGVILWTLLHAGVFLVSFVVATAYYMLIIIIYSGHPPSWLLPCPLEMTNEQETVARALIAGIWCAAPQAAAAAVALMLPRHRRRLRLLLAYAALVAHTAGHSMFAGLLRTFLAAGPGGVRFVTAATIFIVSTGDLLCFLGLILRGGEE